MKELDGSVDASDDEGQRRHSSGCHEHPHPLGRRRSTRLGCIGLRYGKIIDVKDAFALLVRLGHHTREEAGKDDVGGELEDDPNNHGVGPRPDVSAHFIASSGSHTTAHGLQEQREEVDGAEDPEILLRAQGARVRAEDADEIAEDDVDACGEEGGAEDERGDLDLEGHGAVGALGCPGSSDPSQELAGGAGGEEDEPPAPREDCLGQVGGEGYGEEDGEDDARGEGG